MFLAFFSITVNVHSKPFVVQYMHLFCAGTKYLVFLQLLFQYISAILASNYGIISSYLDFKGSSLGWYEVEKGINNSSKFLDLDRNMFV